MTGHIGNDKPLMADTWSAPIAPVRIGGIPVAPLTTAQWMELLLSDHRKVRATNAGPRFHTSINGNVISVHARNPVMKAALARADAIAADGMSVLHAAKLLGKTHIPDRAATTDLFHDIARTAETAGMSIYFFGTTEEENRIAVENVRRLYPGLKVAGRRNGYFKAEEEDAVVDEINAARPDILFIGLGLPRQEAFVLRNIDKFQGVTWVKTCGGLFNFLSGSNSRAPQWMRNMGLEWVYRVALEPRRLFWRYLTTNSHALWLIATKR